MNTVLNIRRQFIFVFMLACLIAAPSWGSISFVLGDIYSGTTTSIVEYTPAGQVVGTLDLSSKLSNIRGISFGPDNLLYVSTAAGSGYTIYGIDQTGAVKKTFSGDTYYAGNTTYGHVAVADHYLYTVGQNLLTRFDINSPSSPGQVIYQNNQMFDVVPMPNGDLLAASAYQVQEITPNGTVVRNVTGWGFTDIRAVAFDPIDSEVFVWNFGFSGHFDELLRINYNTNTLLNSISDYTSALTFTLDGRLLVNGVNAPQLLDHTLNPSLTFSSAQGPAFVTTQLVPEPASTLFIAALSLLWIGRRRRSKGARCRGGLSIA